MRWTLALVLVVTSVGCLGPRADPSTYFVLTPVTGAESGAPLAITLGVGPVTLPGYLDRSELVTRLSENQLAVSEVERWAEPLPASVSRAFTDNLVRLMRPDDYVVYPWYESAGVDYAVAVDLSRFEADSTGLVTLEASWWVRSGDGNETLRQDASLIQEGAGGLGTDRAVAALSTALARLAEEIAAAVRSLR